MALRNFKCPSCGNEFSKIQKAFDSVNCTYCNAVVDPEFPKDVGSTVFETRSKYHGTQVRKGLEKQMKKRMRDHHDKYELAGKIDSEGMDTAQRSGWLKKLKKT